MQTSYTLTMRTGTSVHPSIAAASAAYCAARDASGEGGSTWRQGTLTGPGGERLFVSYNGRVWTQDGTSRDWKSGETPVFCPSAA